MPTPPSVQVVVRHCHFGSFDAVTGGGVHPIDFLLAVDRACALAIVLSALLDMQRDKKPENLLQYEACMWEDSVGQQGAAS